MEWSEENNREEEGLRKSTKLSQVLHCRACSHCVDYSRCPVGHAGLYKGLSCNLLCFKEPVGGVCKDQVEARRPAGSPGQRL